MGYGWHKPCNHPYPGCAPCIDSNVCHANQVRKCDGGPLIQCESPHTVKTENPTPSPTKADVLKCGEKHKDNGEDGKCSLALQSFGKVWPCCSNKQDGDCGDDERHCTCKDCIDYRKGPTTTTTTSKSTTQKAGPSAKPEDPLEKFKERQKKDDKDKKDIAGITGDHLKDLARRQKAVEANGKEAYKKDEKAQQDLVKQIEDEEKKWHESVTEARKQTQDAEKKYKEEEKKKTEALKSEFDKKVKAASETLKKAQEDF